MTAASTAPFQLTDSSTPDSDSDAVRHSVDGVSGAFEPEQEQGEPLPPTVRVPRDDTVFNTGAMERWLRKIGVPVAAYKADERLHSPQPGLGVSQVGDAGLGAPRPDPEAVRRDSEAHPMTIRPLSPRLVLSLFPGIGMLDMAFEEEGFCIVRGPDVLWGGDIRTFHPPAGIWSGIVGGPPCQAFSPLRHMVEAVYGPKAVAENLIPEFERVVLEAQPQWFLMENSDRAPLPVVPGYQVSDLVLNNRWLGEVQNRKRRFSLGTRDGRRLSIDGDVIALIEPYEYRQAVTSSARAVPVKLGPNGKLKRTYTQDGKRHGPDRGQRASIAEMLELQGAPSNLLDEAPFTTSGKRLVIGNGVPLPMGRAIARAVKRALDPQPMTTRPLRHADDRVQELANLRDWRDRMAADLVWVEGLITHVEGGGESDVIRGVHHSPSPSCRSIVEEGRQMDPPDRS